MGWDENGYVYVKVNNEIFFCNINDCDLKCDRAH